MTRDTHQHNAKVAAGCFALLLAVTWIVTQVNLLPVMPVKYVAMWGVVAVSLPVLAVYWAGAMGFGVVAQRLLLKEMRAVSVEAAGLGLAVLLLLGWLFAWAGLMNRATGWGLPAVGAVLWIVALVKGRGSAKPQAWSWGALWWMPGVGLLVVAACCPPGSIWRTEAFGYDVLNYHLQVPREWLPAGGMVELQHNVYSYFPGLFESGFLHLSAMHGSVRDAIYSCQLLHTTTALLAAAGAARTVAHFGGRLAPIAAGGVMLVVPWVMVTGSMAYNEMAMLAFLGTATSIVFAAKPGGAAVGLLCGAATLCKLTAGPMVAVPCGVVLLMRRQWRAALLAMVVGVVTLCPYFARNAAWTGNPVFPFATSVFGAAHWDDELVQRWKHGHFQSQEGQPNRREAIRRQWLLNTGYGAIGGQPTPREVKNIARFQREGGVPVLWIVMAASGALAVWRRRGRAAVGQLAVMMAIQVAFWLVASHLQSRFLVATIVPAAVIVGLGLVELEAALNRRRWVMPFVVSVLVGVLGVVGFTTMLEQTQTVRDDLGRRVNLPPMLLVDSLDTFGRSAIDEALPATGVKVYLVADNSRLLYIDRPMIYHSAFDASPLGKLIRAGGDVNAGLRDMGVTHVWIHWQELQRLHDTYGYDRDVTVESLHKLIATGWTTVEDVPGVATLYALPRE